MTAVLPNGYVTILEAADLLSRAMYAGVPAPSAALRVLSMSTTRPITARIPNVRDSTCSASRWKYDSGMNSGK
jgi:hypothetical protein